MYSSCKVWALCTILHMEVVRRIFEMLILEDQSDLMAHGGLFSALIVYSCPLLSSEIFVIVLV